MPKKTAATPTTKTPPAQKAAPRKRAAKSKKPAKVAEKVRLDEPDNMPPLIFKRKFGTTDKEKHEVLDRMTENIRKSISVVGERSKTKPINLLTPAMIRRQLVPYEDIQFQQMLDSIGFRSPSAFEIVAAEHAGSTTFIFDWIGRLTDMGCYAIYCECEGKMMSDRRMKRLLDRNPKVATHKLNAIEFAKARTLAQLDETLRKTVEDLRKRCDADPATKGNPIFFFADPWGALMSKGEAKGNSDWGLAANAKKEEPKATTDGSNFEHAKHASGMARWLPAFMEKNNCNVVFVNKQNDKVEMKAARPLPGYMQPSPSQNDTRIGGRALKRLCAYRFTLLRLDDIREKKDDKAVIGYHARIMLLKNSYGPRNRRCDLTIYFDKHKDTKDYQAPGLTYADRTASWMVKQKFLGTTVEKDLYTCDPLGCVAVPAEQLYSALKNSPEHLEFIGSALAIEGYATKEVRNIEPQPEAEEDTPEGAEEEEAPIVDGDEPQEAEGQSCGDGDDDEAPQEGEE